MYFNGLLISGVGAAGVAMTVDGPLAMTLFFAAAALLTLALLSRGARLASASAPRPARRAKDLAKAGGIVVSLATVAALTSWTPSSAAPVLGAQVITWDVIGLRSNDVTSGPNVFPVAARTCNTGTATATAVTATFAWTSANSNISVVGPSSLNLGNVAVGACVEGHFQVEVTRTAAAFDTARRYTITFTSAEAASKTTASPREVFVERLISQHRNAITSIDGPTTVYVGQTYDFVLKGKTAPQGYEQLEAFLTLPSSMFQVVSVRTTYSAGGAHDGVYGDACGWQTNPTLADPRSCVGPETFTGKVGGTFTTTYTVKVVGTGTTQLSALIYDFSGSSFHMNGDFGDVVRALPLEALPAADLAVTVTVPPTPLITGQTVAWPVSVTNNGPSPSGTPVRVTFTLSSGLSFTGVVGGAWTCTNSAQTVTCSRGELIAAASAPLSILTSVSSAGQQSVSGTVSGPVTDLVQSNQTSSASAAATAPATTIPTTTTTIPTTTTTIPTTTTTIPLPPPVGEGSLLVSAWLDADSDGERDELDAPLSHTSITISYDSDNDGTYETDLGTFDTDSSGYVTLNGLAAGSYELYATAPGGHTATTDERVVVAVTAETESSATFGFAASDELGANWAIYTGAAVAALAALVMGRRRRIS